MKTLGQYQFVRELGQGGMGEVYLADDTKLGRQVALKILPPELANRRDLVQRFEREAKATAALDHSGIVTLHSLEQVDGVHFLTMAYVAGRPLSDEIADGPLKLDRFANLGRQLAAAVGAAHEVGIVHRDLKPLNVMVAPGDVIKVLDFGLARFTHASDGPSADLDTKASELTAEGVLLGTLSYMSPGQARGETPDARSDVFSLGVILYEMACGRRPFASVNRGEILAAILRDEPEPIGKLRPDLGPELVTLIGRCLQKDKDLRFANAGELVLALGGEVRAPVSESMQTACGYVPTERDAFFGRAKELDQLHQLLEDKSTDATRLVNVLGPEAATERSARALLEQAESIMRKTGTRWLRAELCCQRSQCELLAGDRAAAAAALAEAEEHGAAQRAGPQSEVGQRIAKLRRALDESSAN